MSNGLQLGSSQEHYSWLRDLFSDYLQCILDGAALEDHSETATDAEQLHGNK